MENRNTVATMKTCDPYLNPRQLSPMEAVWLLYPNCDLVTVQGMNDAVAPLGYKLDRNGDCRCNARIMTGELAMCSYPALSTRIVERDSGLSFCNVNARRDDNFKRLQNMRSDSDTPSVVAIVSGHVLGL